MQILFYQYILCQDKTSLINRFLQAQKHSPVKGDWYSNVTNHMKIINLHLSEEELIRTSKQKLKLILNKKVNESAFQYLLSKRKSKGMEINYGQLQMAQYLSPNEYKFTIKDKILMYSVRNRMTNNFHNFPNKQLSKQCQMGCQVIESDYHNYICEKINDSKPDVKFTQIFNGHISNQEKVLERIKINLERRENK